MFQSDRLIFNRESHADVREYRFKMFDISINRINFVSILISVAPYVVLISAADTVTVKPYTGIANTQMRIGCVSKPDERLVILMLQRTIRY